MAGAARVYLLDGALALLALLAWVLIVVVHLPLNLLNSSLYSCCAR